MRDLLATTCSVNESQLPRSKHIGQTPCVLRMATNTKVGRSAACKLVSDEIEFIENPAEFCHTGRKYARRILQAIAHPLAHIATTAQIQIGDQPIDLAGLDARFRA